MWTSKAAAPATAGRRPAPRSQKNKADYLPVHGRLHKISIKSKKGAGSRRKVSGSFLRPFAAESEKFPGQVYETKISGLSYETVLVKFEVLCLNI